MSDDPLARVEITLDAIQRFVRVACVVQGESGKTITIGPVTFHDTTIREMAEGNDLIRRVLNAFDLEEVPAVVRT